jgi:hypothetical protein
VSTNARCHEAARAQKRRARRGTLRAQNVRAREGAPSAMDSTTEAHSLSTDEQRQVSSSPAAAALPAASAPGALFSTARQGRAHAPRTRRSPAAQRSGAGARGTADGGGGGGDGGGVCAARALRVRHAGAACDDVAGLNDRMAALVRAVHVCGGAERRRRGAQGERQGECAGNGRASPGPCAGGRHGQQKLPSAVGCSAAVGRFRRCLLCVCVPSPLLRGARAPARRQRPAPRASGCRRRSGL